MERKQFDISDFYKAVACRGRECISGSEQPDKCEKPLTMVFINMQPLENVYSQDEPCSRTLTNRFWEVAEDE